MGGKAGRYGLREARDQAVKRASTKADWLRPMLEKESDWDLATSSQSSQTHEERNLQRRAIVRITKKALRLMFSEGKHSARYGTGTAHNWIRVEVVVPKEHSATPAKKGETWQDVERCIEDVLMALGIKYEKYLPDSLPGKDVWEPCLTISARGEV